ncbi:MAG: hypothetical protein AAB695_00540 [Patescibacteria group bacterium]
MESVPKQPIHLWLLQKIERAQYLSELLEAGNLIRALKLVSGHALLIPAWEEGWLRVGKKIKVPNLIESEYYLKVLKDLQSEEAEVRTRIAARLEVIRQSTEELTRAARGT